MSTDYRIYRWLLPDPTGSMGIIIPPETPIVEALEIGPKGLGMRRMVLTANGTPTTFPELDIWDDPQRSPPLGRSGADWQQEDTKDLLRAWEAERLQQFQEHCFRHYYAMQVVYRIPPTAEPTHFHSEGKLYQGWRVHMVAAFFAGFKPSGLVLYNPEAEPEPEPETQQPQSGKPRLRLITND